MAEASCFGIKKNAAPQAKPNKSAAEPVLSEAERISRPISAFAQRVSGKKAWFLINACFLTLIAVFDGVMGNITDANIVHCDAKFVQYGAIFVQYDAKFVPNDAIFVQEIPWISPAEAQPEKMKLRISRIFLMGLWRSTG